VYFEVFIEILLIIVYEKFLLLNATIFRGDYTCSPLGYKRYRTQTMLV